jgi:uncharacterized membrane protein YeaQ/YmgE (transglycosylase-associated protein family)
MTKSDTSIWALVGIFVGMISGYFVNNNYTFLGAIAGGVIGYMLGRLVK